MVAIRSPKRSSEPSPQADGGLRGEEDHRLARTALKREEKKTARFRGRFFGFCVGFVHSTIIPERMVVALV